MFGETALGEALALTNRETSTVKGNAMKLQFVTTTTLLAFALFLNACSKGGGSSDSSGGGNAATSNQAFTITQSPLSVAAGGSMMITPSGGTAPYTFTLQTGSGGTLSQLSGFYTTLIAATNGSMTTMIISDSAGHSMTYSVVPTSTAIGTGICSGNYTLFLADGTGSLSILSDSAGNIQGHITYNNSTAAIQGLCSNGTVSFQNLFSGSAYVGTYTPTGSTAQGTMRGTLTDVNGNVSNWAAF